MPVALRDVLGVEVPEEEAERRCDSRRSFCRARSFLRLVDSVRSVSSWGFFLEEVDVVLVLVVEEVGGFEDMNVRFAARSFSS